MIDWNIQPRAHNCQGCGRPFKPREGLHTLLFDERQAYQRIDVCEACWTSQHAQGANHRKGFVSHWQGVYHAPAPAAPEPIQKETAESLLRKLVERHDPAHAGAVFILAVMLERKRLFKVKAQQIDAGRRVLIYEHARSGDVFTIPDPNLQLDQLEAVQRDVAQLLEHGLDPLLPPSNSPAATPPPEGPPAVGPAERAGLDPAPAGGGPGPGPEVPASPEPDSAGPAGEPPIEPDRMRDK